MRSLVPHPAENFHPEYHSTGEHMCLLHEFWNDENGAGLVEYTLLLAFMALVSATLFLASGGSANGVWDAVNRVLTRANPFDGALGKVQGG